MQGTCLLPCDIQKFVLCSLGILAKTSYIVFGFDVFIRLSEVFCVLLSNLTQHIMFGQIVDLSNDPNSEFSNMQNFIAIEIF